MKHIARALLLVASFAAFTAHAQQDPECFIDPDWKQSKINETLEACKQQAESAAPEVVAQNVSAYAEVAKGVAEAIGIAAREVGVAVDEFVKTDAGKMTIALIVWHVAGDDIKGVLFGTPVAIFGAWFLFGMWARIRRTGEYDTVKKWYGEKRIPKYKGFNDLTEGEGWLLAVTFVAGMILVIVGIAHVL